MYRYITLALNFHGFTLKDGKLHFYSSLFYGLFVFGLNRDRNNSCVTLCFSYIKLWCGMGILIMLFRTLCGSWLEIQKKALLSAGKLSWLFWLSIPAKIVEVNSCALLRISALIRFTSWKPFCLLNLRWCGPFW